MTTKKYKETRKRTIIKGILLRIIDFFLMAIIIMLIKGSFREGVEIALLDIGIEFGSYYIYERIWNKISWGIVLKDNGDPAKTYNEIYIDSKQDELDIEENLQ